MNTKELWTKGSQQEWKTALDLYYNVLSEDERKLETEMDMVSSNPDIIREMSGDDFYNFLFQKYYVWKYTQPNRLVTTRTQLNKHNSETGKLFLEIIKDSIFKIHDKIPFETGMIVDFSTRIRGLGVAGASGLLSILFPRHYGTVDQYLVYELEKVSEISDAQEYKMIKPKNLKVKDCVFLEKVMREKAKKLNIEFHTDEWTPKKIDMILWAIHRDNNNKY